MHITTLYSATQGHDTLAKLWAWAKPKLLQGQRLTLSVGEEKRNLEQNAKLHACLTEIARSVEWAGRKWDAETWKRLLTAAWCRTRGEALLMVPAVDGQGVDIVFRRTSQLSKAECSELLEYVIAWGVEHGVEFSQ